MERTHNSEDGWIDYDPSLDGVVALSQEEAEAEEAEAEEALSTGDYITHEQMVPYMRALFAGENPEPPKTQAEIDAEPKFGR